MSTNILLQMYVKYQVLGLKTFTIMIGFTNLQHICGCLTKLIS